MNSNQIVSDSLTEALQDFQKALAPLLELGKVEQWNGKKLKKKKIREAALILTRKCIAILLKKLANWQEAQSRAVNLSSRLVAEKDGEKWSKRMENFNSGEC